ncbi:MAG: dihydroorotase [Armatimonadota bacterium]
MAEKKLVLRGGRIIDPSQGLDAVGDLVIEGGRVADIRLGGASGSRPEDAEVISLQPHQIVMPGCVDVHCHLREPGQEHKETIATGSVSAAAGGFTTVLCMPNTEPPIDNASVVALVLRRAAEAKGARVLPMGAGTVGMGEERLSEMADLVEAGAVAITDDANPIQSSAVMRRVMEYCRMLNVPFAAHCEDKTLTQGGCMHEGDVSAVLGLRGMPAAAEEIALARNILLARLTRAHLHVAHVSTAFAVDLVRMAKRTGVRITAEACPHHFSLTDQAVADSGYDTATKVNPPLRSPQDVEAVKRGLADGTIDCIATDHAPHSAEEKDVEYQFAPFGMVGFETALALTFTELVDPGYLTPMRAVECLASAPARIFGLDCGTLRPGSRADVTVVDTQREWIVDRERLLSRSKNTPFHGRRLRGLPVLTVVDGRIVYSVSQKL